MDFDKSDWQDLNAKSAEEFNQKREALKNCIAEERENLKQVSSIEEFYAFCKGFQAKSGTSRPIDLTEEAPKPASLAKLENYKYPEEFLDWHRKFGHVYCWLEAMKFQQTEAIVDELENDYYGLLTSNGYLFITSDGGGNGFFYDTHSSPVSIKFVDHEGYFSTDKYSLEDFYSEEMGYWFDEEENIQVNEQGIDSEKVFDKDKNYRLDSEYIQSYLAGCLEPTGHNTLLEFLVSKTLQGFDDALDRYKIK